jgi:hypothetical protein
MNTMPNARMGAYLGLKLHQTLGRQGLPAKVDRLIADFRFGPLHEVIASLWTFHARLFAGQALYVAPRLNPPPWAYPIPGMSHAPLERRPNAKYEPDYPSELPIDDEFSSSSRSPETDTPQPMVS